MCSSLWEKIVFFGIGSVFLVLGAIISSVWPVVFNQQLREQLVLTNDSKSFNLWKETPIPMYIDFYLFHWTNPEETLNHNSTPHFIELGPYVFREEHFKVNIGWSDNNETVTFKQIRKWTFLPELSNGHLSDEVTNVNVIAMTMGSAIKKLVPKSLYPVINPFLKAAEKVYVTKTVKELLFDGYHDIFLDIAKKLEELKILKINLPFDKFGWFYNRNMSADYDGIFNMDTGASSLDTLGIMRRWNFKENLPYYTGDCGKVGGTTGELWPTDIAAKPTATIFATDMCSKIDTEWAGTNNIHGASGSLFTGTKNTFSNNTSCYCTENICRPTGIREVSTCRYGAPAFISFPHFYLADPIFREMVNGMQPSAKEHVFDLTLHKMTGVPLSVNARLQINILVEPIPGLNFFNELKHAYMPMIWFNERALITKDLASELSGLEVYSWFETGFLVATGFGVVMVIIGLFLWSQRRWKQSTLVNSPLLDEQSSQ